MKEEIVVGFMDKVKEQAQVASTIAKEAAQKGQAKVDEVQARVQADGTLKELGRLTWLEESGRATPETAAEIAAAKRRLAEWEAEHGEIA